MSLTNAGFLGQNQLLQHLIQDGPYNVQFLQVWPWYGVQGKQLDITTTPRFPIPTAQLLGPCDPIKEQTRDPDIKRFQIVAIQNRYDICITDADAVEVPNNLYAEQDVLAWAGCVYDYARLLDTGNAAPFFPSLLSLADPVEGVVDLAGAVPQLEDFNRTLLRVTTNNGFDVIVMGNLQALATYWSQAYERGTDPYFWMQNVPVNMGGEVPRPQAFVQHARWYVNELIPNRTLPGGEVVTNVYFIQLGTNPNFGTAKGVFGIVPEPRVGNMFVRREHVGHMNDDGTFNTTHTVFWSFPCGVAVAARRSLAVLKDMQIAAF